MDFPENPRNLADSCQELIRDPRHGRELKGVAETQRWLGPHPFSPGVATGTWLYGQATGLGLGGMWGWVNLDREQLRDIAKFLVPGIGAMVLLLLALS